MQRGFGIGGSCEAGSSYVHPLCPVCCCRGFPFSQRQRLRPTTMYIDMFKWTGGSTRRFVQQTTVIGRPVTSASQPANSVCVLIMLLQFDSNRLL